MGASPQTISPRARTTEGEPGSSRALLAAQRRYHPLSGDRRFPGSLLTLRWRAKPSLCARDLSGAPGSHDFVVEDRQHGGCGHGDERAGDAEESAADEDRDEDDEWMDVELVTLDHG